MHSIAAVTIYRVFYKFLGLNQSFHKCKQQLFVQLVFLVDKHLFESKIDNNTFLGFFTIYRFLRFSLQNKGVIWKTCRCTSC